MSEFKDKIKINPQWIPILDAIGFKDIYPMFEALENTAPPKHHVFRSMIIPPSMVRVVIIGQDPYTMANMATGVAFANTVRLHPAKYSPSLKAVMEASKCEDPTLMSWVGQGVLLLNTILTATPGGQPKDPKHTFWKSFVRLLIEQIAQLVKPIFVLWGNDARNGFRSIAEANGCKVFEWTHPSPMADASLPENLKFAKNDNFARVNECLDPPIRWNTKQFMYFLPMEFIFTDGACSGNGTPSARAAWAYVRLVRVAGNEYKVAEERAEQIPLTDIRTNNRAELLGILRGLESSSGSVGLISDSGYAINVIHGASTPTAHIDLIRPICEIVETRDIFIKHIFSHKSDGKNEIVYKLSADTYERFFDGWNERVDRLATNQLKD